MGQTLLKKAKNHFQHIYILKILLKTANNKKEDYYPFSDSLVKKITSSAEKAVHIGWICTTKDNNSDSSIEDGFSVEIDLELISFKNIIKSSSQLNIFKSIRFLKNQYCFSM